MDSTLKTERFHTEGRERFHIKGRERFHTKDRERDSTLTWRDREIPH